MANFYKKSQSGRSMVEMLGVLAIIGMLSIGSISAYSHAMFKYQLNKHSEDTSLLINNAISLIPTLQREYGRNIPNGGITLNSLFADTSMLPDSMHYDGNHIYDIFKNKFTIRYVLYTTSGGYSAPEYLIYYVMQVSGDKVSPRDKEICRNFVLVAKENAANISNITLSRNGSGQDTLYGDMVSWGNKKLRNAGIAEIDSFCGSCEKTQNSCSLITYLGHWKSK